MLNLRGEIYGNLIVIDESFPSYVNPLGNRKIRKWRCLCFCGREHIVLQNALRSGRNKSCGLCSFSRYSNKKNSIVNHKWFSSVGKTQAYMLGFIYGDGSVSHVQPNTLSIGIHKRDVELLRWWQSQINSKHILQYHDDLVSLRFVSKVMCADMKKYGIVRNKTYITQSFSFLDSFNDVIFHSWLKGLIDADGCISKQCKRNGNYSYTLYLTGYKTMIYSLQKYLLKRFEYSSHITISGNTGNLRFYQNARNEIVKRCWNNDVYPFGLSRKTKQAQELIIRYNLR